MKNTISTFSLVIILIYTSCSQIEENNDPIIGIWNDKTISEANKSDENLTHEWTFNDAYLGRYHQYKNNVLDYKTDFRWTEDNGVYTITYPGTNLPDNIVSMVGTLSGDMLEFTDGNLLAIRE
ncbi:hypothetical protein GH721_16605 [Kriegella sp. EG-1]|nr:hypothetical protein [Flavobacteriaceae bacterium EG-1]